MRLSISASYVIEAISCSSELSISASYVIEAMGYLSEVAASYVIEAIIGCLSEVVCFLLILGSGSLRHFMV